MDNGLSTAAAVSAAFLLTLAGLPTASAISFNDPDNFQVKKTWGGTSLNLPGNLGGMLFSQDGKILYAVGNSQAYSSALYAVPVTRDPATSEVLDLGPADRVTLVFSGNPSIRGLGAGWEVGPGGTLFYTYWNANYLGERPGGLSGTETLFDMSKVGLPTSVAGLTFSPHVTDPNTGFGMMQVSVWEAGGVRGLYDVKLTPIGGGLFEPTETELFVNLPREGTGAIQYIPSGPFTGNMMYVNWDYGEVQILVIDRATGLPIDDATGLPTLGTDSPRVVPFASGLGVGPWGLEFDPLTNDFFVSTWQGNPYNTIIQVGPKGLPPPEAGITALGRSGAELTVEWYGPAGWTHILDHSPAMLPVDWQEVLSIPDAPGVNVKTLPLPPGDRMGFFRVKCVQP